MLHIVVIVFEHTFRSGIYSFMTISLTIVFDELNMRRWENMPKVVIVYLSTSGNTKAMADAIAEGVRSRNVEALAVNFHEADIEDLRSADAIAIGSSTFYYKMLPPMEKFIESLAREDVNEKIGAAFGSYGWSGEAPVMIAEKMRQIGMKVIDPVLRIQYAPTDKDLEECKRLGKDIAIRVKAK